jgi:hypothetical protein
MALSRRGFDHEAILILPSGSVTIRLGLIKRGRTPSAVRVWNKLARAADPSQRCQFSWASLGRPVARWAMRERSKGRLGWASGEVSAQGHFLGLNPFLFSKLFSNLQITLNSTQI